MRMSTRINSAAEATRTMMVTVLFCACETWTVFSDSAE